MSDFKSLQGLKAAIVNRKKNVACQQVEWLKIRWIRVTKDKPLQFSYKDSHNTLECWKTVSLKRKTKGRPVDMGVVQLSPLYPGPRQISQAKLTDLKQLLSYVPPVHHAFFMALTADADGSGESDLDSDCEMEVDSESDMESDNE